MVITLKLPQGTLSYRRSAATEISQCRFLRSLVATLCRDDRFAKKQFLSSRTLCEGSPEQYMRYLSAVFKIPRRYALSG